MKILFAFASRVYSGGRLSIRCASSIICHWDVCFLCCELLICLGARRSPKFLRENVQSSGGNGDAESTRVIE